MNLYKWISKSPNYIRSFGLLHGLRLLFSIEHPVEKKSTLIKKFNVPGYPQAISLRETISDHSIFWQCLVLRQYNLFSFPQSERLMSVYQECVENGHTPLIIDCGGNIGLSTVYLATMFPEAKVYVIEPDDDNFAILKSNSVAFGDRVVALKGGIWNESGHLKIVNPESGSAAFRVEPTAENTREGFRAYTIDEICKMAGVNSPLIVKIDIEGAQKNLFQSNADWLRNTHLIMLELDDWLMPWQGTSRPFFSCISQYPFDYLITGETLFCFRDFKNGE